MFGGRSGDPKLQLTEFSGEHTATSSYRQDSSWNNTGGFSNYRDTPSGNRSRERGSVEIGTYTFVDGSGTVAYSGHGGAFNTGNAQYATAYDNTADSFNETLQVDMWGISPQLNAVNWDSPLQELIRSAIDFANYLGDTGQELLDELGLFYSDFSGNLE